MWTVFAEEAVNGGGAPAAGGWVEMAIGLLPMVLIIAVMYFLMIRPQRKKDKEKREMLANLKVGDKVVTIGGIVGQVARIKDDKIFVETGSNTEKQLILMERWAISTVEKLITD